MLAFWHYHFWRFSALKCSTELKFSSPHLPKSNLLPMLMGVYPTLVPRTAESNYIISVYKTFCGQFQELRVLSGFSNAAHLSHPTVKPLFHFISSGAFVPLHFTGLHLPLPFQNAPENALSPISASPNFIKVVFYNYFQSYCLVQPIRIPALRKVQ